MKEREILAKAAGRAKASLERHRLVWGILLAGVILVALPTGQPEEVPQEVPVAEMQFDLAALETRLAQALSKIHGAGEVTVVLTLQNGPRQVLAQDVDRGMDREERTETVVLSRGNSSQETVTVQELYPSFQGALLVCPGGDDPTVRLQLTEATSALTGLGADKISISKGK